MNQTPIRRVRGRHGVRYRGLGDADTGLSRARWSASIVRSFNSSPVPSFIQFRATAQSSVWSPGTRANSPVFAVTSTA
jgi:hypothetical protein